MQFKLIGACAKQPVYGIFTTNASESVNAILKRKVDYKKNELPVFIDKVNLLRNSSEKLNEQLLGEASTSSERSIATWKFLRVSDSQ